MDVKEDIEATGQHLEDSKDDTEQPASVFEFCDMHQVYNELQFGFIDKGFIDIRSESEFDALKMHESGNIPFDMLSKSDCDDLVLSSFTDLIRSRLKQKISVVYIISNEELCASNKHIAFSQYLSKLHQSKFEAHIPIKIMNKAFKYFASLFPFLCYTKPADRYCFTRYPSQIINDRLYLGNLGHSIKKEIWKNLRITHIVNVSMKDHRYLYKDMNMNYLQCPVEDLHSQPIDAHFDKAIHFIAEAMQKQENRILVHCQAGVSRSASVIIAYLMKQGKMSYNEAYRYTKARREIIDPNAGFVAKLKAFEQTLTSENSTK